MRTRDLEAQRKRELKEIQFLFELMRLKDFIKDHNDRTNAESKLKKEIGDRTLALINECIPDESN